MSVYGTHLVDTSAIFRLQRDPEVHEAWRQHVSAGLIVVCPAVELEVLRAVGGPREYVRVAELVRQAYGWVPMPHDVFEKSYELQEALAAESGHQGPSAVDLLIAVTARHHGLKVLHYDRDFVTIAKAADVETEWVAPPGSVN
ncbi:PIN domain nuclease [Streptosporangium canum]|uniref:PIN domain nuclease n=1 Tax=Streptosporangium canum TaxID=324952 RepID=UPI0033B1D4A7